MKWETPGIHYQNEIGDKNLFLKRKHALLAYSS